MKVSREKHLQQTHRVHYADTFDLPKGIHKGTFLFFFNFNQTPKEGSNKVTDFERHLERAHFK